MPLIPISLATALESQWLSGSGSSNPSSVAESADRFADVFSQWFSARQDAQADDARKTVLAQPTQLAGVEMPAGTTLRLGTPGDLASFDRAVFPEAHPAQIQGVTATRLFRYPATAKQPETLSAEIARDQALEGWLCAHGHRIEFVLHDGHPQFSSCHLAIGNTLDQPNRQFFLQLAEPVGLTLARPQATGTIRDDDLAPTLTITDASVTEGNTGTNNTVFTARLSTASGQTVTVDYSTADIQTNNAATGGIDYLPFSDVEQSVRDDVSFLQGSPLVPDDVLIRGFVYNEKDGRLTEVS